MPADALAPDVTRSSGATMLTEMGMFLSHSGVNLQKSMMAQITGHMASPGHSELTH